MNISKWSGPIRAGSQVRRRCAGGISSITTSFAVAMALLFVSGAFAAGQEATSAPPAPPGSVKHIVGFENIKANAKGELNVGGDGLEFKTRKAQAKVSISAVQDVFTGQDFKQVIGGTTGTLAKMAIPYGGGRVLSLFQERIDVLTVEYRDAGGGLHGAIFTLPKGQAPPLKRQMVALGAHASIPPEEPAKPEERKP